MILRWFYLNKPLIVLILILEEDNWNAVVKIKIKRCNYETLRQLGQLTRTSRLPLHSGRRRSSRSRNCSLLSRRRRRRRLFVHGTIDRCRRMRRRCCGCVCIRHRLLMLAIIRFFFPYFLIWRRCCCCWLFIDQWRRRIEWILSFSLVINRS